MRNKLTDTARGILLNRFRSPHLNRLIAANRLDRASLIALADSHCFPTELMDELCDFLEGELIKIIVKNGKKKVVIPVKPIPVSSTRELNKAIRTLPRGTVLHLTDEFHHEYFCRVMKGMNEDQLKFYDRVFNYDV